MFINIFRQDSGGYTFLGQPEPRLEWEWSEYYRGYFLFKLNKII